MAAGLPNCDDYEGMIMNVSPTLKRRVCAGLTGSLLTGLLLTGISIPVHALPAPSLNKLDAPTRAIAVSQTATGMTSVIIRLDGP